MYESPRHSYALSFLPPKKGKRLKPELVFIVSKQKQNAFEAYVRDVSVPKRYRANKYLGEALPFVWKDPAEQAGFFWAPHPKFGFGSCGYYVVGDELELHLPIDSDTHHLALTLAVLTGACDPCFPEQTVRSNRQQLLIVESFVRVGESAYGHPLQGELHPSLRQWLRDVADKEALAQKLTKVLRTAWKFVTNDDRELRRYSRDCCARIRENGAFMMECFGNACDIAIYPDLDHEFGNALPTRFGCHNLDQARQQIVLLCGLAALYEIAAKELQPI